MSVNNHGIYSRRMFFSMTMRLFANDTMNPCNLSFKRSERLCREQFVALSMRLTLWVLIKQHNMRFHKTLYCRFLLLISALHGLVLALASDIFFSLCRRMS